METGPLYRREQYRVDVDCPAMFSDAEKIGEARMTNVSVLGCTLDCGGPVARTMNLHLRLFLPDSAESLPVAVAEVRWTKDRQVGIQFHRLERKADLRLHGFVWDRMLDRLQALKPPLGQAP